MIPIDDFSPNPLRQGQQPTCIPCSYACAVSPLVNIDDCNLARDCISFQSSIVTPSGDINGPLGLSASASGYDGIVAVHQQCNHNSFVKARSTIEIKRIGNNLNELENQLKSNRATAIIAVSYPATVGRAPHSVAIAYDRDHGFFIRDSAQHNTNWNNLAADATGSTVVEALRNLDAAAIRGEAIIFLEKQTPPAPNNP